jgi:hypothetical protein
MFLIILYFSKYKMIKKHKKSSKKKYKKKYNKSSMKDILVRGGEISSSIGVVMAWIVGIIFILIGIFMIVIGIDPGIVSTNNGICTTTTNPDAWCVGSIDKDSCQKIPTCNWHETKTHGSFQAAYICGGIALIMFSVGMIVFSYWWNRKVHADSNMAAFAGGMAAMNVLSSGMNRGYY